ncbi:MAG: hypothetical protein ACRDOI_19840 [Trebonia sp.]
MRAATLVSWLVTASLGAFMLRTWLARGGLRRERAKAGGLPPQLIFGHATAALAGLLVWAAFLGSGTRPLAWAAVALLMVAVGLGLCTVTLWTPYPARKPGEPRQPAVREVLKRDGDRPEFEVTDDMIARFLADPVPGPRHRPIRPDPAVIVPVVHGFAALATFTLAVMSAIR